MLTRLVRGSLLSLTLVTGLLAQAPYLPSNEPDATKLMADRIRFVRDMYQLDTATTERIVNDLKTLVPFQEKYLAESAKSISRIELAYSLVANDTSSSEADKQARQARFKSQLEAIHSRAPLSLGKVVGMVDAAVPPEKANAAHAKMATHFAPQLAGRPFAVGNLDGYVMPPPKMTKPNEITTSAQPPQPPPAPSANTTPPTNPSTQAPKPTTPPTPPLAGNVPPPAPPAPPREIKTAPPVAEWQRFVEESSQKFKFSPEQRRVADKVLDQCKTRAEAAKSQPPAEGAAANHKPADLLYDELIQRVEALASAEQRSKAQPAAAPPAAPTGK